MFSSLIPRSGIAIVLREGNGNPLQCSCLENPRDRGAWWAAVYGVAQSWTWLKWLSSSSSIEYLACTWNQGENFPHLSYQIAIATLGVGYTTVSTSYRRRLEEGEGRAHGLQLWPQSWDSHPWQQIAEGENAGHGNPRLTCTHFVPTRKGNGWEGVWVCRNKTWHMKK